MNNLETFKNADFGEIRTVEIENEIFFVATDVCRALGIDRTATRRLDDDEKGMRSVHTPGGVQDLTVINEYGLYALVLNSRKPSAKAFKRWITHEVIPAIRRTGSYSIPVDDLKAKRLAIMENNSKIREAQLWEKLAQGGNETFKQVCRTYAANTLAGKQILALPEVQERTYTATEIAEILGITPHKLGRLANLHDMKVEKYGKWYHDKARYSSKEVEVFRYYENAIPAFKALLKGGEA